jgi:hypothetical protein
LFRSLLGSAQSVGESSGDNTALVGCQCLCEEPAQYSSFTAANDAQAFASFPVLHQAASPSSLREHNVGRASRRLPFACALGKMGAV